jgi:hypothetical protein
MKSLTPFVFGLAVAGHARATGSASPPNIIFIHADDYGIGEVGFDGSDNYKTPNGDALARSGTRHPHG